MMSSSPWSSLWLHALLSLIASVITVKGLRLLQRMEAFIRPVGASRINIGLRRGDYFPWELLSQPDLIDRQHAAILFLVLGEDCGACRRLIPVLPGYVRDYSNVKFVIYSKTPITTFTVPNATF